MESLAAQRDASPAEMAGAAGAICAPPVTSGNSCAAQDDPACAPGIPIRANARVGEEVCAMRDVMTQDYR